MRFDNHRCDKAARYRFNFRIENNMFSITPGPGSTRRHDGLIKLPHLDGVQHVALPAWPMQGEK